jgi:AAA ATPase domain
MTESAFVGRADIMAQVLGGRTSMFFDVEGIPGIGKTALLDQLAKLARPEDAVIRIDGEFFEAHRGRARDEDADLGQFRRLLRGALKSLPDDEKITDVLNYLSDYSSSTQGVQRADFVHDSDEILERAIAAANHIGSALAETQARFLVLVDDFHLLAGRPIGQWVMTWLAAVRGADVVLAHQEYGAAEDFALPARAVRLKLGNLSREDVKAYLKSHPDIGPDVDGIVGYVWDFTGGYPDALALVADLIKGSGDRDNAVRLVQQLVALQGGRAAQLEALVNRILDMIHDEELRDTLYKVCVTRHFDVPLVELLMKVDDLRAQTLIERLMHYSFVRKNTGEHSFYAVSDFVRRIGEERLGPDRTQKTHDVAEGYYHKLVDREVEDDESSYQRWFRYEQPEFQALERDWLYHLSRLTGNRRRTGRISIAKIFLDAFWWWGSYIPFRFCEQILADWAGATLDDDEDLAWGTLLRTVYNRYPKGWRKADTPADQWTEVRLALRHLMDRGSTRRGSPARSGTSAASSTSTWPMSSSTPAPIARRPMNC